MSDNPGTFILIKHPDFDSFSIIHIFGEYPTVFPSEFEQLMPGNKTGHHKGVKISKDDPYLEDLKANWPEGFKGFEDREENEIKGIKYRPVAYQMMI